MLAIEADESVPIVNFALSQTTLLSVVQTPLSVDKTPLRRADLPQVCGGSEAAGKSTRNFGSWIVDQKQDYL